MQKPVTSAELITDLEQQILTVYEDPTLARQYAWWTLETITHQSKAALIAQDSLTLTTEQQVTLEEWLEKLIIQKMPIAYLIGSVPFCDREILVEQPILIPRPETEEWCSNLIAHLTALDNQDLTILDLCSGSGCIAIALANALPKAKVYAVDISDQAIALTQKNIVHNQVHNVTVLQSDLFDQLPKDLHFDCIVSNPPYIAPQEWSSLDASVTEWEDKQALVAQDNGLALIKRIIAQAPAYIKQNQELQDKKQAQLMIEIGYKQGPVVSALMRQSDYTDVAVYKDLEHNDRVVVGRIPYVAKNKS